MTDYKQILLKKITSKQARVGFVGLGYVGLPWAAEFALAGFHVYGIDISSERISQINLGVSYIPDVGHKQIDALVKQGKLTATTRFSYIKDLDTVNVCVPTPLRKTKDPDISYIVAAIEEITEYLHPGMLIVLESTSYPGTTEELVLPILEKKGLAVGKDFFLAFSPERVDPGNKLYPPSKMPKIVGGVTPQCTQVAMALYNQCIERVVSVSSPKTAEMAKLLENTFRIVNIGLVNEIALMSRKMGVDVWEVIEAASSKPFGFMRFNPGPGLGGHCIPVDPFYLSWKARSVGFEARFIELAGQVNNYMPEHVVRLIADSLNSHKKSINGSHIFILGVAYKKDINDVRESPSLDIIKMLLDKGAKISYADPYIPQIKIGRQQLYSQTIDNIGQTDCVVILTDHSDFDYPFIAKKSRLVVDTRNALKGHSGENIVKL